MVAFLSITFSLGLLGLTIYGLHRYQTMAMRFNGDRSLPLPPLRDHKPVPKARADSPPSGSTTGPVQPAGQPAAVTRLRPDNWLARVSLLKKQNDYDRALTLCMQEFPLWSAYNQACIIYRTKIKAALEAGESAETLLVKLYRTAAQAELLHEVTTGSAKLRLEQLRRLDLSRLGGLDFPYQDIGYTQLRLIRKNDIKLMQEIWGRPHQHSTPRQLHQSTWQAMRTEIV